MCISVSEPNLPAADIANASAGISDMFIDHFKAANLSWVMSGFNGRSDYGPFIANGIPAGGLDSGADGTKTVRERDVFGGVAQTTYDPCYHQACDTTPNCNHEVITDLCTSWHCTSDHPGALIWDDSRVASAQALGSLSQAAAAVLERMMKMPRLREFISQEKPHYTKV